MQYSSNYNLNLVEGTDIVNPLVIDKPNYQTIDAAMKANKDAAVNAASHTKAGTVHAIVRTNTDANTFRFVASAPFVSGDTFTVDGVSVTGINTAGEGLNTNDFVIGASVLCILNLGTLTLNVNKNVTIPATYDADDIVFDNTGTDLNSTNAEDAIKEVNRKFDKYVIDKVTTTLSPSVVVGQNVYTYFVANVAKSGYKAIGVFSVSCGDSHIMFGNFAATSDVEIGVDIYNPSSTNVTISSVTVTVVYEAI